MGYGLIELLYTYIIASLIGFLISIYFLHKKIVPLSLTFDLDFSKKIIRKSIYFGIASLFMVIYTKIDVIMLSKLAPSSLLNIYVNATPDMVIGWYSAAFNLVDSLIFIPIAITAALAPIAARAFINNSSI